MVFTPNKPYETLASVRGSENQFQLVDDASPTLPGFIPLGPMFRVKLYSSFIDQNFPSRVEDPWYSVVTGWPTQPANTDLFQKSLTAWACVSLGKSKDDQALLQYGITLYNQAIRLMSNMMRRDPFQEDIVYSLIIWTELEVRFNSASGSCAFLSLFHKLICRSVALLL